MAYEVPDLPYAYNALEPHIDEQTMRIHHDKHHQAYVDKANAALEGTEWADKPVEEVLEPTCRRCRPTSRARCATTPAATPTTRCSGPCSARTAAARPSGDLAGAINSAFGSFDALKKQMTDAGVNRFGSGWSWLVVDDGALKVTSTANQDSPISDGQTPILGIDVWEHAYYLKYQNRRPDYLAAIFNVIDWSAVAERYTAARSAARHRVADTMTGGWAGTGPPASSYLRARVATVVFFPEGAFGPTNNCVGIGDVLRERGHRVVFIIEESFAGTLEARGFEERLMRLGPAPEVEEVPGQFWKDFIRDTAPVFRTPTIEQLAGFIQPTWQALLDGSRYVNPRLRRSSTSCARRDLRGQRVRASRRFRQRAAVGADRLVQPARGARPGHPPVFSGYAGGGSGGLGRVPGRVRPHPPRPCGPSSTRSARRRARRRCPTSSSCTRRRT